jgi:hypothetical protein
MRSFLGTLRKLVLGETWRMPAGVAIAVAIAAVLRVASGPDGWWRDAGGAVLAVLLVGALLVALQPRKGP